MVRVVRQNEAIARYSSSGRSSNAQNQFGRRNCADARWCRSLGHLDYSGASRHASRRTDRSVADHDRRKAPACCPLSRLLPGVQLSGRPCWHVKPEHGSSSRGVKVMVNSAAIARPFRVSEMHRGPCRLDDAGPKVVQFPDGVRGQNANPTTPLNRYIEGWAQTDLEKILDATGPSYRFTDPLVGSFVGRSLQKYFDLLQDRLSCT